MATMGRVVPYAPYLAPLAIHLLENERHVPGQGNGDSEDVSYLLGLFRLLRFDRRVFRKYVHTTQLWSLLRTSSPPVIYLIIRIMQIHLQGADHWFETTLRQYLGDDNPDVAIEGPWDDRTIDYRFLSLWEQTRSGEVRKLVADVQKSELLRSGLKYRVIPAELLHSATALIGGVVLPSISASKTRTQGNALVETETTRRNLGTVAHALKRPGPLLLTGLPGSGKTLLVQHAARSLGKFDKMVTLHLNEQSDAKILLGVHTTGDVPGTFTWKPGVLTTAVQEGRWVLIEDLDKAPNEVLGTLLPLIEKSELSISNRKETVYAAEGFRILATVRSTINHRGEESRPLTHMVGSRHWQKISIATPTTAELAVVVGKLYPSLDKRIPQFMAVYERLVAAKQQSVLIGQSKTGVARSISPRDLLKWCKRVAMVQSGRSSFASKDIDDSFLEAVDCFLGALPDDDVRSNLASVIAEELHIDPERKHHLLRKREAQYKATREKISSGRYTVSRARHTKIVEGSFSTNPHTCRTLESVLAAVVNREPLLLVGETGVGKTTAVQHLATQMGKKLVPFNLSQQTEAGDLLGGFKPVNPRTLMIPLKDEFDDLFSESFPSAKNDKFITLMNRTADKNNWLGVCKLFRTAIGMVDQERAATPPREEGEAPAKKRKTGSKRVIDFGKWDAFLARVEAIEGRLNTSDKAVAFTFLEGNIVKAVRNGDWVLLDEINLASSDTLESIVDLLDATPSLLLTEAGNIERIDAHPDFRVFAAMNPATDVGKKDLPPGIRSRFTELYVESPDKDAKSLESIVRSWLGSAAVSDVAIASDVRGLYQNIIALSQDNRLVDGAGQKPHFSLRTLTRTLSYAKHIQQMCSLRRALYEGFQMSFLTFLDTESAALVQPHIEEHLFKKTKINVKAELKRALRKPEDNQIYVQGHPGSKHWIRKGAEDLEDQPQYIITSFVGRNLENLVRAASTRQFPVLIQGPTSAGKTSMIEYLARRTGHKFTRINNHEHTDLQEYLGTYVSGTDGRLQFQEGVLVKALREGHWIVLDELNLAPTDVLEALNRLLDDNRELLIPETQETIRPHPDFMLFATQNPAGLYGGRKTLSRAFRNRFLELHFDDIPINELQEILERRTQQPASRCARIVTVYRELSNLRQQNRLFEQKSFATLRDLFRWALRPNDTIEQLAENGYMLLCERVRKPEERIALKDVIEKAMSNKGPKVRIDEDALYAADCPEVRQHIQHAADRGVVWTKAMRRLYVLVSRAIANDEPVLLVGETGCGKTTVCQMLADALKKTLHMVNAHQNTETGDLIGSQRPLRNRGAIEETLRSRLLASPPLQSTSEAQAQSTEELLSTYDQAVKSLPKDQRAIWQKEPGHLEIQTWRTRFKALFEWVDGSLVQSMREGQFFLLDEISLADDSVLERINSVLESSRTILLAEKGSLDSAIAAASGFQFFATMNPGGDYGKRELSPALRNRFTEIWVPAMSGMDDVLQIVESKLATAARPHAMAMIQFATWFKQRFDTSASSAVSIRDILAWTQFVNAHSPGDLAPAIVHGAAMVYIDTLGANPAGLMSISSSSLADERGACFTQLGRLLDIDACASYGYEFEVQSSPESLRIGPFRLECERVVQAAPAAFTFDPPTTRSNAMRVLRALQLPKPVLLEGSPGVGKTALVTAIAAAIGMPLARINLSDQTDLIDLFGSDAPVEDGFGWRDAPFLRAMKNGEWVLLDEMNLASQSVLEGLNACLDHRGEVFVPELGLSFARHPRFRLFAAQNPHHQGGGRKGLPASFVNRFTVVYADTFKAEDLNMICQRSFPSLDAKYIEKAVAFVTKLNGEVADRHTFGSSGGPWEFNLRDITRWLALASSTDGLLRAGTPRDFVEMLFAQRFRTSYDRICVANLFDAVFGENQHATDLYCNLSTRTLQVGLALLPRSDLGAQSFSEGSRLSAQRLRAVQSIMLCVHKAWPVILAGGPGVGKTTTLEELAACVGAEIVTLGMSAETDALDLIGGYEQHDPHRQRAQALSTIRSQGDHLSKLALAEGSADQFAILHAAFVDIEQNATPAAVSRLLDLLPDGLRSTLSPDLEQLTTTAQAIDKARFEWIDGPLIDAIQQGKWVILDNANLCSPSVLDRLNGLMEPNGVLIVNEHCAPDGAAQIITPHPGFRIFLTVDPRLGDLSRAMRNRAVEIFLDAPAESANASTGILQPESAMTRFSILHQGTVDVVPNEHTYAVARDHLAFSDESLLSRFRAQWSTGPVEQVDEDASASSGHLTALASIPADLQALYQRVATSLQAPADYARVQVSSPESYKVSITADGKCTLQTVHPLNNQPFVQQSQQVFAVAVSLAVRHDIARQLGSIDAALATLRADRKLSEHLARFWKTARRKSSSLSSLLDILEQLVSPIRAWLEKRSDVAPDEVQAVKSSAGSLIAYCWTLLRTLRSTALDVPLLTATAIVGQSLSHHNTSALERTVAQFQTGLHELGLASDTTARHAFVAMWQHFRPVMPKTMDTLRALLHLEDVIDKFDQSTLSFRLPIKQITELRLHFRRAHDMNSTAEDLESLAEKALASLPVSQVNDEVIDNAVVVTPHFATSFEALFQRFTILSQEAGPFDLISIEVLSRRRTVDGLRATKTTISTPAQLILGCLRSLSSSGMSDASITATNQFASAEAILDGIMNVGNVNLQALSLLETETKTLGYAVGVRAHTIAADPLPDLDVLLQGLLNAVLHALAANNELGILQNYALGLLTALESKDFVCLPNLHDANERIAAVCRRLHIAASYSCASEHTRNHAAKAWCALATACLDLYVPEHAFDPVQESQIRTEIFQHTIGELQARLRALQVFRRAWVGESDSLRCRLLEEDIRYLGDGPAVVEICRPTQSKLSQLHGDLQALARILSPLRRDAGAQSLNHGAWSNLSVIRGRLDSQYRAYADLAAPVVGFIDCLAVAQQLAALPGDESRTRNSSLASVTPLSDAGLEDWINDERLLEVQLTCRSKEEQILWLSVVAARSSIVPLGKATPALRSATNSTLRLFYEAWTRELGRDQRLAARNSSLYQYRGGDDESEEATLAELNELFPSYEREDDATKSTPSVNAQTLASRMAAIHHRIHTGTEPSPDVLLDLLQQASQVPATRNASSIVTLINALHKLSSSLSAPQRSKNIYTDPDIGQAKTLVALLDRVTNRFEFIHSAWPDHATPIEALRACNAIMALGHSEPLARFLPFVEKLHGIVNEWQKVASSEYSVLSLLEEITSVIVSWRQLELATWAGLFDQEDEACKQNASSWWYIAYETIIAASEEESQSTHSLAQFSQQLLETLGGFLTSCGLGEFRVRLSMLVDFEADLASRAIDNDALRPVRNALSSLIEFYSHFTASVTTHWTNKRAELEKQIKEVVQLASWKDRNIEALKRSAKNSHNRLLRSVKKYRMLLAEPVAPLLQSDFPAIRQMSQGQAVQVRDLPRGQGVPTVHLQAWSERPQMLRDLSALEGRLTSNVSSITVATKASAQLEEFLLETQAEAAELRKATPATSTEKNKSIVQQLKTRKRRLLADVFREVQAMGFQKNLGDDVLAQQQSLHGVLSKSPPLRFPESVLDAHGADYEYHRFVHVMPTVRASTVKHNEDLTPAEIARGKTLLESMLQVTTQQRTSISQALVDLTRFTIAVNQLTEISKLGNIRVRVSGASGQTAFIAQVRSLLSIVRTIHRCVRMQSELARTNFSGFEGELITIANSLQAMVNALCSQISLPETLTTSLSRDVMHEYNDTIAVLSTAIGNAINLNAELEPLLSHVLRWTGFYSSEAMDSTTMPSSANVWTQRLLDVLGRLRASSDTRGTSATSGNAKKSWLLDQQQQVQEAVRTLDVHGTRLDLEDLISSFPSARPVDGESAMDQDLDQIAIVCAQVQPVLAAYAMNAQKLLHELCNLHATINRVAYHMATSFIQLAREGFCAPSDKAQGEEQQSGEAESGTGLGDGEGGDDISKDIGADEDLSELAQEATSKEKDGEMEAEKDAVDMADEDLQGDFDEDAGSEGEEQEDGKEDGEDAELDEETGHIGEDDDAVDEKTWDDGKKAEEADKDADKGKGTRNDDQAAAENAEVGEEEEGEEAQDEEMEEDAETGAEADAEFGQPEREQADPHMQDEQNLDLPDDLQMDGDKQDISDIDDGDDVPDELSEIGDIEEDKSGKDEDNPDAEMAEGEGDEEDQKTGEAQVQEEEDSAQQDEQGDDAQSDVAMLDSEDAHKHPEDGLKDADAGQGQEEDSSAEKKSGAVSTVEQQDDELEANEPSEQTGATEGTQRTQTNENSGQAENGDEQQQSLPFKQLGDVLKQWYNQHRNIEAAQEPDEQKDTSNEDIDMSDPRFEHLPENAESDMQALGAASAEQSKALDDQNAIDVNDTTPDDVPLPEEKPDESLDLEREEEPEPAGAKGEGVDSGAKANQTVIGKPMDPDTSMPDHAIDLDEPDDIEHVDEQLTQTHLSHDEPDHMTLESARQEWSEHENRTRNMAIVLTEHLRLILQPTQATKMRGDFRTGKRLNIKKIIPYIASSYKRDKIWMRRSVPSKRTYQIMLAIDDSESMDEAERKGLAFDTLALLAKSMAMLEVGELSVLGFGESTNVAHSFDMPFTSDAGAEVVRQMTFSQSKTDVKRLLEKSIELFRNARLKATGSASNLWQLQLIISDGLCEDHPAIRQLVRQAHEEQIMLVFIVIDATAPETMASSSSSSSPLVAPKQQSILDLQRVEFGSDANGDSQVLMRKYLDTFPFRYYLIVRDVLELPSVLAGALRQWFAEVVGSDG